MAYKQPNNPFSQQSYRKAQLKRFGHQKESKFQYDIRMRKEARRAKEATHDPDSDKLPTGVDATPYGDIPEEYQNVSVDVNDLTDKSKVQNYGIVPGMTFGQAFAQAGKMGAHKDSPPFEWFNPKSQRIEQFIYELKK